MSQNDQITIAKLSISLGQRAARFRALKDVSLNIKQGEFVCLLGPSGCGKSTLLGALAGHLAFDAGSIIIDGRAVRDPAPERGLVFQHHTLFPWLNVIDNVAYGLKMQGADRQTRQQLAAEMLDLVGLAGFEKHYPRQLSGGMQQRVEIARVLVNRPKVLLMDEPFGALDALTRLKMQQLLLDIWQQLKTTVVFVTHDIDEALLLADRIVVMSHRPGQIIEDYHLDAARPRSEALNANAHLIALKRHCLALLHDETSSLPRLTPLGMPEAHELRFAI